MEHVLLSRCLIHISHRAIVFRCNASFRKHRIESFIIHSFYLDWDDRQILLINSRWEVHAGLAIINQKHSLLQVIPNSRMVVVPPEKDDVQWQSRLYLTPSRLLKQSVIILASMCGILLLLIAILHYRERQQDRKERQSQTHRFHFAM